MLAVKMEAWACSMRHALCILAPLCDSQDTACDNLDSFIATRVKHSSAAGSLEDHQRGLVARVAHRDDLGKRGIHMDADMYLRQRESESWARQLAWPVTIVGAVVLLCAVSSVFSCKAWRRRRPRKRLQDSQTSAEDNGDADESFSRSLPPNSSAPPAPVEGGLSPSRGGTAFSSALLRARRATSSEQPRPEATTATPEPLVR